MAQKHTINDIEKPMTTYGPEQGPNKRYRRLRHPAFPAATWTDKNPLLQKGEIGAETDTHKAKIGDGVTYWNDLSYITAVGQPLSTADYQMGNAQGGWTTMTTAQQDALNSGATTTNIGQIATNTTEIAQNARQIATNTTEIAKKVNIDGTSIMTAPLKFASGSMRGAVGPYLNGVGFWKMDAQGNITNIANLTDSRFLPVTTNAIDLGRSANEWKDLYLAGKVYVATINNGADLSVPNKSGTLATMGDVELAARSGRMLTDQGVWYAKMYSATVPPSAEDDTNYADFSQVDNDNNPIIVIYTRISGAWVQSETITPPADYDGYVPITSKIWDISEQSGQQGGRVLWNHTSKEFTPYPVIISFEDIEITGESTVIMPNNPSTNQIVNKDYVDTLVSNSIGDATITLTQGGQTMGSFTTNQSGDATIALDGGSSYRPDLFDWKWADHQVNDVQWLRADTFSWQAGSVYKAAYKHLRNDMYQWYSWENNGTTIYTKKAYPEVGEKAYSDSALTTEVGEITDVTDTLDITVEKITVNSVVYDSVIGSNISPTTETVGGVTVQYIPAEDGHKIVTDFHESEVADVYTATGVAWYYIIDYGFKRFKLPRTKFGVTGLRDTVGKYVAPGLPNITGDTKLAKSYETPTGACVAVGTSSASAYGATGSFETVTIDASQSNSIYGNSTTVQPPATQMYLYFYVGEFTQTALENTAGITAETLNDKTDTDASNFTATGQDNIVAMGRSFTNANTTIAHGNASIAGTYTLGFADNKVKIGVFECCIETTQPGFSSIALATDVMTNPTNVAGTNNQFRNDGSIMLPFINEIKISFPVTSAGVGSGTTVKFKGYM